MKVLKRKKKGSHKEEMNRKKKKRNIHDLIENRGCYF